MLPHTDLALAAPQLLGERGDDEGDKVPHRGNDLDDVAHIQLVPRPLEQDRGQVAVVVQLCAELLPVRDAADDHQRGLREKGEEHEEEEGQLYLEAAEALQARRQQRVEAEDRPGNRERLHGAEDRTEAGATGVVDAYRLRGGHLGDVDAAHGHLAHIDLPQRDPHLAILIKFRDVVRVQGQGQRADEREHEEDQNQH